MEQELKAPHPGPQGLPFIGSGLSFAKDPLGFLVNLQNMKQPIIHQKILGHRFFMLYEPEMAEHVLVKNAKNYVKNKFLTSWNLYFGKGLLTAEGDEWKHNRRIIQPLFAPDRISSYAADINACIDKRIQRWSDGQTVNIHREMNGLTLDIFLKSFLGMRLEDELERRLNAAFDNCMDYFFFTANPAGVILGNLPLPIRRRYLKAIADIRELVDGIIAEKRRLSDEELAGKKDLVSVLVHARDDDGSRLSDQQIRDELMTFLVVGSETTALTATYGTYLLSTNENVQRQLSEEVRPFRNKEMTQQDLAAFPFLKKTVQEALRLYPSSWMVGRDALADDVVAGYAVPKNSSVIVPIWSLHRDARVFEDPNAFNPARWTDDFSKKLHRTKYMPFGYGPRMCIGFNMATLELQLIFGKIFSRFSAAYAGSKPIEIMASFTARPKAEIPVTLKAI